MHALVKITQVMLITSPLFAEGWAVQYKCVKLVCDKVLGIRTSTGIIVWLHFEKGGLKTNEKKTASWIS